MFKDAVERRDVLRDNAEIARSSKSPEVSYQKRIHRRKALFDLVFRKSWIIRTLFFIVGYTWMLLLPTSLLDSNTWIDENALQPNSVKTHWDWDDVHSADRYLEKMESMWHLNVSRAEYVRYIAHEFEEIGLPTATQAYQIQTTLVTHKGENIYASLSAPRSSNYETIVLCASWLSLSLKSGSSDTHNTNLRGVASVMALARHFKQSSFWGRDIIFVISDGYLDGMLAFLDEYHALRSPGITADPLDHVSGGVIWTALCIDYPGHSFHDISIYYEGTNARLPNQDLFNSLQVISKWTGGSSVITYDYDDSQAESFAQPISTYSWGLLQRSSIVGYLQRAQNILTHLSFSVMGRPSGIHGLFHQFRIDAVTLFARPADGPHGFHALGRITESTMRTMNNLLERLHASFFFYLLTGPTTFISIGKYLPSAVLVGIGMELNGLHGWVSSGWRCVFEAGGIKRWSRQQRPVAITLSIMFGTHLLGFLLFTVATSIPLRVWQFFPRQLLISMSIAMISPIILGIRFGGRFSTPGNASVSSVLHALSLCIAGTISCIISVLNFSLAACAVVLLGIPLSMAGHVGGSPVRRILGISLLMMLMPAPLLLAACYASNAQIVDAATQMLWDWEALGAWLLPSAFCVYYPIVVQMYLVALLT